MLQCKVVGESIIFNNKADIKKDNLIDVLIEERMFFYFLVSLFSAGTLTDLESCHYSLNTVEKLRKAQKDSRHKDDKEMKEYIDQAEQINLQEQTKF